MEKAVNLIREIEKSHFLLLLLDEEMYLDKIAEIAKSIGKGKRICYVCLSKSYKDVYDDLKKRRIDVKRFYFIDALSSHYKRMKSTENCKFLSSPTNLMEIRFAISKAIEEKGCETVVFDTISTMLIYQETSKIVRFTHEFLSEERERSKILYLVLKHESIPTEDNERLVKDLGMFADKMINLKAKKGDI
jgi:KaiC/GvpD/RAD55 family RecA-like ATPase